MNDQQERLNLRVIGTTAEVAVRDAGDTEAARYCLARARELLDRAQAQTSSNDLLHEVRSLHARFDELEAELGDAAMLRRDESPH